VAHKASFHEPQYGLQFVYELQGKRGLTMPRGRSRTEKRAPASRSSERRTSKGQLPFPDKLILNQWILSLFNVTSFESLAEVLRDEALEGLDEHNNHRFFNELTNRFFNLTQLPTELLLEYDQHIVSHTRRISEKRMLQGEKPIVWKYFQYLALLFTEIYLDRFFSDPQCLLEELNTIIAEYNKDKDDTDQIEPFDLHKDPWVQLNKISYWMATGSGKTLVMHVNILQFLYYLEKHGRRRELNRIILLTPNEGLSQQHLHEFELSGIEAEIFQKEGSSLFAGHAVEIIEITKIREDSKEKTIAVDSFLSNNLVLVDEGHRGASSGGDGAWMQNRNRLCEQGFSFEYSATFGQAVQGNRALVDQYAKSILVDYSYHYFYKDGFGKDYQILNLDEGTQRDHLERYLVACLLTFYQQLALYLSEGARFRVFQIERPLWIFVGGSVTATLAARDASDIVEILQFFARYVKNKRESIQLIHEVLNQGIVTADGKNIFERRFTYLNTLSLSAEQIFDGTLKTIFNAPGGGTLYIENLKGAQGEIALRLGADNDAFGVINVGDDTKLIKLCAEKGLETGEREFSGSLFSSINNPDSSIHVLIGSKKFSEGWSSWRVSTMGLMNVGKSEGSQIIQLFGRGVRLKGYNMSLKRSSRIALPHAMERPKFINILETLGIFGIHADYMAQFRDFLVKERVPIETEKEEILLPVLKNVSAQPLKMVRLQKTISGVYTEFGEAFRKIASIPTLSRPDPRIDSSFEYLQKNKIVLNWYPKIQAIRSAGLASEGQLSKPHETHLSSRHVALLDIDSLYFELERYKAERGWFNLNIPRNAIKELLLDTSWYILQIPESEVAFSNTKKIKLWEEIALALLKKYTEHFYTFKKRKWELPHIEVRYLEPDDQNLLGVSESPNDSYYYRILVDKSEEELISKIKELKSIIESGQLSPWEFRGMQALWFSGQLIQPLLFCDSYAVEIQPAPLNRGEKQFILDLREFYEHEARKQEGNFFAERKLYLLRNLSRGKGVGFFEAGNFHPDFILWLVEENAQHVIFLDPKGVRNIGPNDPKVEFYSTIKDIESRLGDTTLTLDSYIVSDTPFSDMCLLWDMSKDEMLRKHIVFQEDGKYYIENIVVGIKNLSTAFVP
jgi:hypothetical protein